MTFEIVPAHLAVQAMRDNGYRNAAYALAELIDNAIQAGADHVELLCAEEEINLERRRCMRVSRIAVLDNGSGMDAATLRMALQFGNGTHLNEADQKGIGKFGMGLPASSISQCTRVDVWSWKKGPKSAIHTYLDLKKIKAKDQIEIPIPQNDKIDDIWLKSGKSFAEQGTLIVWSSIDRCIWKTAKTIIDNSELLIGRMYRKFIDNGKVKIRMASFEMDQPSKVIEKYALPNDPGYLMKNTSCPSPFHNKPMFEKWGETVTLEIEHFGKKHTVNMVFSYAREEARQGFGRNPGQENHGQHAMRNVGVSLVRAERELELDKSWANQYDSRERWWGAEVEFPPALDELFGVTNNKQSANNFSELAKIDIETLLQGGKTIHELRDEMREEGDPRWPLIEMANVIRRNISALQRLIHAQKEAPKKKRYEPESPEGKATEKTKERQKEGHVGESDESETLSAAEKTKQIEQSLIEQGIPAKTAEELAKNTTQIGYKYLFANADLGTSAFFSVKPGGGTVIITLNTSHPAYRNLVEVLEEEVDAASPDELKDRLVNARNGLKLLLEAWARYEDEQPEGRRKEAAQDARSDWGRVAREFLSED